MQAEGRSNLGSIVLLIVSGLGLITSLLAGGILLLVGLVGLFGQAMLLNDLVGIFALVWISALTGLLALPSVIFSTLRLLGREWQLPNFLKPEAGGTFRLASILLFLWPLLLAAGNFVAGMSQVAWLLLPPLHLLAICLPIWWLVELARRGLPGGSSQRGWGILSTSLFVTTPSVIIIELLGLVVLIFAAVMAASMVPAWLNELEQLAQRIAILQNNPQATEQLLQGYLQNPIAIYGMLATLAFIVPLLEELFKPLAIWFLLGRRLSPAEGFVAGAICGGAFTLLESLMTLSSSGQNEGWAAVVIARAGTSLLHISTTALLGWALASAWSARSAGAYLRLLLSYLLAASLHGIWNGLSIIFSVGAVLASPPPALAWLARLAPSAPLALLALVGGLFIFLWSGNRHLRNVQQKVEPSSQ